MSYAVEYINCKICGSDQPKFLGTRGNLEYAHAKTLTAGQEHMLTCVVKCAKCGFIYTNPMIVLPEELKISFYNCPEDYQASSYEHVLELFNHSLDLLEGFSPRKGKLLDIGAGKGEFLAAALKRGWEVFGVEPSPNFVQYANEKFGLNIQNSTLEKADFAENYFDAITLNMVLEHVEQPHSLLSAAYRVLKPGGVLYIEVPNMDSMLLKLIKLYFRLNDKDWSPHLSPLHYPHHCYGYSKSTLKFLCEMHKLTVKKFFVFDIGLRGFRNCAGNKLLISARQLLAKCFSLINQGDILIAIVTKEASSYKERQP